MIDKIIEFFIDIFLWLPRFIYSVAVDVIESLLQMLPEPDGMSVDAAFSGVGSDVLYFLTLFQVQYGIAAIMTALIARFLLRRIPFIG